MHHPVHLDLLLDLWDGLEEVSDESVVGHLEDGRLGVLVDSHNGLGVLHAGQVLDGTADADGNVQLLRRKSNCIKVCSESPSARRSLRER